DDPLAQDLRLHVPGAAVRLATVGPEAPEVAPVLSNRSRSGRPDALADELALELRERGHDRAAEPAGCIGRIDPLPQREALWTDVRDAAHVGDVVRAAAPEAIEGGDGDGVSSLYVAHETVKLGAKRPAARDTGLSIDDDFYVGGCGSTESRLL